jgi:hypothetical protein
MACARAVLPAFRAGAVTVVTLTFGRHKGQLITRVPVSYLQWMVRDRVGPHEEAEAELKRRGTTRPEVDLTPHAIDRASQRLLPSWQRDGGPEEGLYSWLCRRALEAFNEAEVGSDGKAVHKGIVWVFADEGGWPVVKTVMWKGEPKREPETLPSWGEPRDPHLPPWEV